MRGKTWFGTRGYETWVPTPAISPQYDRVGYENRGDYLHGGAGIRASKNAHQVYTLSWPPSKTAEQARLLTDFADGVYDATPGVNLIYWIDPMSVLNVLNQAWATPSLGTEDAPVLIADSDGSGRPKPVPTPANSYRYPARSAFYVQEPDSIMLSQYIPIPPGYSAWVGIHGEESAQGRMQVQPVSGQSTMGDPVIPAILGVEQTRVNTEFSSANSSGIVLSFVPVTETTSFIIYALAVQILPTGQNPRPGNWITGQGHSGCQFVGKPSKSPYSAAIGNGVYGDGEGMRVAVSAKLEETGMDL